MPRRLHLLTRDHGQSSLEWLAIVTLISTLFALGTALAQADAVGRRITREMARALCIVRDGDCQRDHEPCVVDAERDDRHVGGSIAIFRLDEDHYGLIEHRSDGTWAATIAESTSGGVAFEPGLKASAEVKGVGFTFGGEATASGLAEISGARTWIASSEAEARSMLKLYGNMRPPDRTSEGLGWMLDAGASAKVGGLVEMDIGSVTFSFDHRTGSITDHRTGRHTIYVKSDIDASAEALVLGSVETRASNEVYALELSASGRPLALTVTATGPLTTSRDLPAVVQPVAGRLAAAGAERYEVTAALDLTESTTLAAASGLLDAIAHKRPLARPSAELRRLLGAQGTVEVRILATEDDTKFSFDSNATAISMEGSVMHHEERLLAAASRGLDGQWLAREDCV